MLALARAAPATPQQHRVTFFAVTERLNSVPVLSTCLYEAGLRLADGDDGAGRPPYEGLALNLDPHFLHAWYEAGGG